MKLEKLLQLVLLSIGVCLIDSEPIKFHLALLNPNTTGVMGVDVKYDVITSDTDPGLSFDIKNKDETCRSSGSKDGNHVTKLLSPDSCEAEMFIAGTGMGESAMVFESNQTVDLQVLFDFDGDAEGFLAYPDEHLGTEYFVVTFCTFGGKCQFAITPVEDGTSVDVALPASVTDVSFCYSGNSQGATANIGPLTMNEFDVLQVVSDSDLTGTKITSNKPIAVFAGSSGVPDVSGTKSFMVEQLLPTQKWSLDCFVVPHPLNQVGDLLRVITKEDDTEIEITGYPRVRLPKTADHIQRRIDWGLPSYVIANKPISCVQFSSIDVYNGTGVVGNPAMILSYGETHLSSAKTGNIWHNHFANCPNGYIFSVAKTGDFVSCYNYDSSQFVTHVSRNVIPGSIYEVYQYPITGVQKVLHSSPEQDIGGLVYCANMSAYMTRLDLSENSVECEPTAMSFGDKIDNDCDGEIDEESCTQTDMVTSGTTSFGPGNSSIVVPLMRLTSVIFKVQTCAVVMLILPNRTNLNNYVTVEIYTSLMKITLCAPNCNSTNSTAYTNTNPCASDFNEYEIDWSTSTDVKVRHGSTELLSTSAGNTAWEFSTMTATSLGGNASFEIAVSGKDCQKITQAGGFHSTGRAFVIYHPNNINLYLHVSAVASSDATLSSDLTLINQQVVPSLATNVIDLAVQSEARIITLKSTEDVSVACIELENMIGSSTGYTAIPVQALTTSYIAVAHCDGTHACSCVVASLDLRTQIWILPPNKEIPVAITFSTTFLSGGYIDSNSFVRFMATEDISGTVITSNRPVAVFCGSDHGERLHMEQIPPAETLGTEYFIPITDVTGAQILRIVASMDSTVLEVSSEYDERFYLDFKGDFSDIQMESAAGVYHVTSNKPIMVAYITGIETQSVSLKIIPAVNQFREANVVTGTTVSFFQLASGIGVNATGNLIHNYITTPGTDQPQIVNTPQSGSGIFGLVVINNPIPHKIVLHGGIGLDDISNETCALTTGTQEDGVDNDCDGLEGEEYCYAVPTPGTIDFDIDGSFNEDCCFMEAAPASTINVSPISCTLTTPPSSTTVSGASSVTISPSAVVSSSSAPSLPSMTILPSEVTTSSEVIQSSVGPGAGATSLVVTSSVIADTTANTSDSTGPCTRQCMCPCAWATPTNVTEEELTEKIEKIEKELIVDTSTLSATVRKKISVQDNRPSSTGIGYIGAVFLTLTFGSIIFLDLSTIQREYAMFRENMRALLELDLDEI